MACKQIMNITQKISIQQVKSSATKLGLNYSNSKLKNAHYMVNGFLHHHRNPASQLENGLTIYNNVESFNNFINFQSIMSTVLETAENMRQYGKLTCYDTAYTIAKQLNIAPDKVYLYGGEPQKTLKGFGLWHRVHDKSTNPSIDTDIVKTYLAERVNNNQGFKKWMKCELTTNDRQLNNKIDNLSSHAVQRVLCHYSKEI